MIKSLTLAPRSNPQRPRKNILPSLRLKRHINVNHHHPFPNLPNHYHHHYQPRTTHALFRQHKKTPQMSSSLAPECSGKKERYDTCFIKWYSEKYLRGEGSTDECAELFKEYKICLNAALKQRGIHSMIEEARKTSPNNNNVKGLK